MNLKPFYEDKLSQIDIELDLSEKENLISEEEHHSIVVRLIHFFKRMKVEQEKTNQIWQPEGEWKNYNDEKSYFYNSLIKNDFTTADDKLRNFWRNELSTIVKEYARFDELKSNNKQIVESFTSSIKRNYIIWKDIYSLPTRNLEIKKNVGNPWGCIIDDVLITPKAIRYHHNALQLIKLLKASSGNTIAEIGAGYCSLCYYLVSENPDVKYINFDLPETLVLAAYYLLNNFPDKKIFLYGEVLFNNDTVEQYDILLFPNYMVEKFKEKSIDVFFNSFSLSEMPRDVNKEYIKQIYRLTKSYFLHNNMDRKGVVNRGFERIPASEYPISEKEFVLLAKNYDIFHSHMGDYKEFLYKVI